MNIQQLIIISKLHYHNSRVLSFVNEFRHTEYIVADTHVVNEMNKACTVKRKKRDCIYISHFKGEILRKSQNSLRCV